MDKLARREVILNGVMELLVTRGLEGVTHRAVDEIAGLPQGSSTYYFPKKATLSSPPRSIWRRSWKRIATSCRSDSRRRLQSRASTPRSLTWPGNWSLTRTIRGSVSGAHGAHDGVRPPRGSCRRRCRVVRCSTPADRVLSQAHLGWTRRCPYRDLRWLD